MCALRDRQKGQTWHQIEQATDRATAAATCESLEPRRLLSQTWIVSNKADDGSPATLRYAIDNSASGDSIRFDSQVFSASSLGTIVLNSQLEVSHNLSIDGGGVVAVNGNDATRVFQIDSGAAVVLANIAIEHGGLNSTNGGGNGAGILSGGTLVLQNARITFNAASSGNGSGVYSTGVLTVSGSTFSSNGLNGENAGGALFIAGGSATISASTFTQNLAQQGGAVMVDNAEAKFTASTFIGNVSVDGNGGAIFNGHFFGAPIQTAHLSVSDCTFLQNNGQSAGALDNAASVVIVNSTFSANHGAFGGAIVNSGTAAVTNCTIAGNSVSGQGGGIYATAGSTVTLNNTIVAGNTNNGSFPRDIFGTVGGAYNLVGSGGSGGLVNGVDGNLVGVADPKLATLGSYGGPTQVMPLLAGSPAINAGNNALAVDATPSQLAADQRGLPRINNGVVDIGAYEVQSSYVVATTTDETSVDDGQLSLREAINFTNSNQGPESITIGFDTNVFNSDSLHTIALSYGVLGLAARPASTTIAGPGDDVVAINTQRKSRVFYIGPGATVEIDGVTIAGGYAGDGTVGQPATVGQGAAGADGGGIYMAGGSLTLNGDSFIGNSAGAGGAGADNYSVPTNHSGYGGPGGNGGALYIAGGNVTAFDVAFSSNSAGSGGAAGDNGSLFYGGTGGMGGAGGAVYLKTGNLVLNQNTIAGNTAGNGGRGGSVGNGYAGEGGAGGVGGGVYALGGFVTMNGVNLTNNAGGVPGLGGSDIDGSHRIASPGGSGGGAYIVAGSFVFTSGVISGNRGGDAGVVGSDNVGNAHRGSTGGAGGSGGGVYVDTAAATISNSEISNNLGGNGGAGGSNQTGGPGGIGGSGGGLYVATGMLTLDRDNVTNNLAGNGGTGGQGTSNGGLGGNGGSGGALFSAMGGIAVSNTTFANCGTGQAGAGGGSASGGNGGAGGSGGAVYIGGGSAAFLDDSYFANAASIGAPPGAGGQFGIPATKGADGSGAAICVGQGVVTLTQDTIVNNMLGGGVSVLLGRVALANDTIVGNGSPGITIGSTSGVVVLNNSIVTQNGGNSIVGLLDQNPAPGQTPSAYNVIGVGGSGGLNNGTFGNLVGVTDPRLAPLGAYGGPTKTMPPLPESPAVNAGLNILAVDSAGNLLTLDQRGLPRIIGGTVDIGAAELQSLPGPNFQSLPSPTGLAATSGADEITLTWTPVAGAASYSVYRGSTAGGESGAPIATGLNSVRFTDTTATGGATYFYEVTAVDAAGESSASDEASATAAQPIVNANATIRLTRDRDQQHIDWTIGSARGQVRISDTTGLTIVGIQSVNLDYSNGNPLPNLLHLNGTFTITGLQGTNPLAGKTLDIGRSTVRISYQNPAADPIASIRTYLATAYAAGTWSGTAPTGVITSADAKANPLHNTGIAWVDAAEGSPLNTTPNTILLTYAVIGDTDLDGTVGLSDYTAVVRNFATGTNWTQGLVTYDGTVGLSDYTAVVRNFAQSLPAAAPAATTAAPAAAALSATPTTATTTAAATTSSLLAPTTTTPPPPVTSAEINAHGSTNTTTSQDEDAAHRGGKKKDPRPDPHRRHR